MGFEEELEDKVGELKTELVFNKWKQLFGYNSIHHVIQNGLDNLTSEDVEHWKKVVLQFEKDYKELKKVTWGMLKQIKQRGIK